MTLATEVKKLAETKPFYAVAGAGELGEKPAPAAAAATPAANGNGNGASPNGKGTLSGRFKSGTQREKRRTSLFGKLKDVFSHPKTEEQAST